MSRLHGIQAFLVFLIFSSIASAAIVEHIFHVKNVVVKPLCKEQMIPSVNGSLPGPTINVREGDTLVVHVINNSTYNITIHWHGVFHLKSSWMDGTNMITQCPIQPSNNFTYRFDITGQEGTLFWHAHILNLRATLHGALIIRPRFGRPYPFLKPYKEVPLIFEQWWNMDVGLLKLRPTPLSDAFLINGLAGDSYSCSRNRVLGMFKLKVVQGKTYLLRIINAALNNPFFFKIANHNFTVVAMDAVYTTPYISDVMMVMPGQTLDALFKADQPTGSYYMAISSFLTAQQLGLSPQVTRGLIIYEGATSSSPAAMPSMPGVNDVDIAHRLSSNITGLVGGPHWIPVPRHVDEKMFITMGFGLEPCPPGTKCQDYLGQVFAGSLNNRTFVYPKTVPLQEAYFYNINGIYTDDFPDQPPLRFDYTNFKFLTASDYKMMFPEKKTSVKTLKFNSTVEIVVQNTAIFESEDHPMHLHGYNFYVLGYGFGNYDPIRHAGNLNLVNPQMHNTVVVPSRGWIVLRFIANNPGVWMFHCHMDLHLQFGMNMAFLVQNGPTPETTLLPPPSDLPRCTRDPTIYESPTTSVDLSY